MSSFQQRSITAIGINDNKDNIDATYYIGIPMKYYHHTSNLYGMSIHRLVLTIRARSSSVTYQHNLWEFPSLATEKKNTRIHIITSPYF